MSLNLLFLGAPGVGKGTFAKIISTNLNLLHISPGKILREELSKEPSIKNQSIQEYVKSGRLVPDEIVCNMVFNRLQNLSNYNGFLLDGFPRNLNQCHELDKFFKLSKVIEIKLDYNITLEKLLSRRYCITCGADFNLAHIVRDGYDMPAILPNPSKCSLGEQKCSPILASRNDDNEKTIKNRFDIYEREAGSILSHYSLQGIVNQFDVVKGIEDWKDIQNLITA